MKYMKKIILGVVFGLLFISCEKQQNFQKLESKIPVVSVEYKNKGEFYNYDIVLPQIEKEVSEDITYFNLTMQENMRYIIDKLSVEKDDGGIKEAYISFENKENSFNILSIIILTSVYTGGAHPNSTVESYNIALDNKSILTFEKIFNDEAKDYFNMAINDKIRNREKVLNLNGNEVTFFENAEADIKNAIVYFEKDDVVFLFQQYDLAPYSSGMPVFKFNKKGIKKYFN